MPSKKEVGLMESVVVFMRDRLVCLTRISSGVKIRPKSCPGYSLFSTPAWLLLAALAAGTSCSGDKKTAQTNQPDSVRAAGKTGALEEIAPDSTRPVASGKDPAELTTWTYENRVEAVDESVTHRASLTSPTRLQFGFPYAGGSTVRLGLRERDNDALVSLHVSNGVFNKSFQGGSVQIRFDAGPPVTYRYSAAENGSATIIFLDQPDAILRKLKSSRTIVVDLDFYNQGNRQCTFRTAGLRWPY